jgi:hypothetical protein
VGFFLVSDPKSDQQQESPRSFMEIPNTDRTEQSHRSQRLPINVDLLAIGIGLTLAVLIRFGVIHQITF